MKQKLCLLLLLALNGNFSRAQEKKVSLFTAIDVVSMHSWRGGKEGRAPSIEPTLELRKGKVTIGAWFGATLDNKYKELDLYLSYAPNPQFSISLFDYYCPPSKLSATRFYDLDKGKTHHLFDMVLTYEFKEFPLQLTSATLFAGKDRDASGDFRYSTYWEAAYTHRWEKYSATGILAGTPWKSSYADKAAFVNLELAVKRHIELKKKVSMPVSVRLVHNPYREKTYFIVGISFQGLSS